MTESRMPANADCSGWAPLSEFADVWLGIKETSQEASTSSVAVRGGEARARRYGVSPRRGAWKRSERQTGCRVFTGR
jgi:hypothetical protein